MSLIRTFMTSRSKTNPYALENIYLMMTLGDALVVLVREFTGHHGTLSSQGFINADCWHFLPCKLEQDLEQAVGLIGA